MVGDRGEADGDGAPSSKGRALVRGAGSGFGRMGSATGLQVQSPRGGRVGFGLMGFGIGLQVRSPRGAGWLWVDGLGGRLEARSTLGLWVDGEGLRFFGDWVSGFGDE